MPATLQLDLPRTIAPAVAEELLWLTQQIRPRRLRTMREFAEQEFVHPTGEFQGRRFRCDRQPFTRLWLDEVDSGDWTTFFSTGPTQSGKTMLCSVLPCLYHLFEIGETVIFGLPSMDMASEKWAIDLLPAIRSSRFAHLLPRTGDGSRGSRKVETVYFRNGAVLKFMAGGGGDKQRAHFHARVLVVTETDGMDASGGGSYEADKIEQLIARLRAYPAERRRIYAECTVTVATGRTWREYTAGSQSRIALPCPHCAEYVTPEREHLVGHKEAQTEAEAVANAAFACPACGQLWTEAQRRAANLRDVLVHRGQSIDRAGQVTGPRPPTRTLGFRWSPVNNMFLSAADIAVDELKARQDPDEDNAERKLCQFVWAVPYTPPALETTPLSIEQLAEHARGTPRGFVPDGTTAVTGHVDIGKWLLHYLVLASRADAGGHVVDYGRVEVASADLAPELAVLNALRQFRDVALAGWATDRGPRVPDVITIDCGYLPDAVFAFVAETNAKIGRRLFWPARGYGAGQRAGAAYNSPRGTGQMIRHVGDRYHITYLRERRAVVFDIDADHWKSFVHRRLTAATDKASAYTVFTAPAVEHTAFFKHLTAEKQLEEFVPGRGIVTRWTRERKANHWLDCLYTCAATAHFKGARLVKAPAAVKSPEPPPRRRAHRPPIRRHYG
ncbi:MAG: terminase gpA endonuclease subunit [Planctomycetota bacterium]